MSVKRKYTSHSAPDPRRKLPADYHILASSKGLTWLGPEVRHGHVKTGWRCQLGHEWRAGYNKLKFGQGCPVCARIRGGEMRRKKPSDYHELAGEKGITWLGPDAARIDEHTQWLCARGHQWSATYTSVQGSKQGCPHCAGIARRPADDYHLLAARRGYTWLGPDVNSTRIKTMWRCAKGHEWLSPYSNIQAGHGCPTCARPPKSVEEYIRYKRLWSETNRKANPEKYRALKRLRRVQNLVDSHKRLRRLKNIPHAFSPQDWERCLAWFDNSCAVCGNRTKLTLDHWIAVSDPDCPGTIPSNVVCLCGPCNYSKGNRPVQKWVREKFGEKLATQILARVNAYLGLR